MTQNQPGPSSAPAPSLVALHWPYPNKDPLSYENIKKVYALSEGAAQLRQISYSNKLVRSRLKCWSCYCLYG